MHGGLTLYQVFALASYVLWWAFLPVLLGVAWLGLAWSRRQRWPGRALALLAIAAAAMVAYAALTTR